MKRWILLGVAALALSRAATVANAGCGTPLTAGDRPAASDCLFILRAAVGASTCGPACSCDLDAAGGTTASDALLCLRSAVGQDVVLSCPCAVSTTTTTITSTTTTITTTTTTTTLPVSTTTTTSTTLTTGTTIPIGDTCPERMVWTIHAGVGAGITKTETDIGWAGFQHNMDHLDASKLVLRLEAGPGAALGACGVMEVTGIDPSGGNCRCKNDRRIKCDEPLQADTDCGGEQCECYLRPPEPTNSYAPYCYVWRFGANPDGSWNVDSGSGSVSLPLRRVAYSGEALTEPCPTCNGDDIANDGLRNGTCSHGENDGQPCDANASDASFPPPDGGDYSYDCFPASGKNVSGAGLVISSVFTTGTVSLAAEIPCGVNGAEKCPCGICSDSPFTVCSSNADCTSPAFCKARGILDPLPNGCVDGACSDAGGGEGLCTTGPDLSFCDAVVHANGEGYIGCASNVDCAVDQIGIAAGNCTLTTRLRCFDPPIEATGTPSATDPVLVAEYCVAAGNKNSENLIVGLPGPARDKLQVSVALPCTGGPEQNYPHCP